MNDVDYSVPIWRVDGSSPACRRRRQRAWASPLRMAPPDGAPIPAGAGGASGTDGAMIYQASTHTLWEFWRAAKKADVDVSWGARPAASRSPGYDLSSSWPGLTPSRATTGARPPRACPSSAAS